MNFPLADYTDIIQKAWKSKTQYALTYFLREHNFQFISEREFAEKTKFTMPQEFADEGYQGMAIRMPDETLDTFLVFGMKLRGTRHPRVIAFLNHGYVEDKLIPLGHHSHNFRKPEHGYKFPAEMTYDERKEWRKHNDRVLKSKELEGKDKEFYLFWKPQIQVLEKKRKINILAHKQK